MPGLEPKVQQHLEPLLERAERIHTQQRQDQGKVYSMHAPEVECISKGKAHKKYEFGVKVQIVTTSRHGWIVGMDAVHGNPYDGETLTPAIEQMERLTGAKPTQACVDRGFRGRKHYPEGVEVLISGRRGLSPVLTRLLRRRAAIEPTIAHAKIAHAKSDHGLERNHLQGKVGDRINAMLSACGLNLRKLLHASHKLQPLPNLRALWRLWQRWLQQPDDMLLTC